MNKLVKSINKIENMTVTANGDTAYKSTTDAVLDFFYNSGASRNVHESIIVSQFKSALAENEDLAVRALLYARDIREALGERRLTRIILEMLSKERPDIASVIIPKIVDLGRWDDILVMLDGDADVRNKVFVAIDDALHSDNAGLVAKWMPRKGKTAARIRGYLRMSEKDWRKLLAAKTNVVEQRMCAGDWQNIDYSAVPSVASGRYAKAFQKHDLDGYSAYLQSVMTGKVNEKTGKIEKINTEALYPYNIYNMPRTTAQAAWDNLKDFVGSHSFLPIIDVSGSMVTKATGSISCLEVAISLGTYLAQHNKSDFKNLALTFSGSPAWIKINPNDHILDTFEKVRNSNWSMNTNLDAAMEEILEVAVNGEVPQSDIPEFLIIFSDMQFDSAYNSKPASKRVKDKFNEAGYKVPNIIWWNLNAAHGTVPVKSNADGMILVSGFSPAAMQNVLSGEVTPVKIMETALNKERYNWK